MGAVLVVIAAASGWIVLVFLGLAAFGAGAATGLQARFAATEVAAPGFEARYMSLVLWATAPGSITGPLLAETGAEVGAALGLPPLVGPFLLSGAVFAISSLLVATLLRLPKAGCRVRRCPVAADPVAADDRTAADPVATGSIATDPAATDSIATDPIATDAGGHRDR